MRCHTRDILGERRNQKAVLQYNEVNYNTRLDLVKGVRRLKYTCMLIYPRMSFQMVSVSDGVLLCVMVDVCLVVVRRVVAVGRQAVRVRAIRVFAVLRVRLVAPEEVALRGRQHAARVREDDLVEARAGECGDDVRERGDRSVVPAGRPLTPYRHGHKPRPEITGGVGGETVRSVTPDHD